MTITILRYATPRTDYAGNADSDVKIPYVSESLTWLVPRLAHNSQFLVLHASIRAVRFRLSAIQRNTPTSFDRPAHVLSVWMWARVYDWLKSHKLAPREYKGP